MAKVIYQYLIEPEIYAYLEQKQRKSRHKTLSHTLNWILKQNIIIEKMAEDQQSLEKQKKLSVIDELEKKYNLKRRNY